ncbi:MAG: phosphate ABC transporter substrate-binding protein [Candidatus Brocadiae bacterium]|nr:phosphate ABC transporter substrate-binding protein [Candidatus Brocadiia bacterium]
MRLFAGVLLGLAALTGCGGGERKANHLTVAGSTAFTPVAQKLADAFKARRPGVTIDVHSLGSMVGIKSTNEGGCDIGMADLVELPETAKSLKSFAVARDGIAVVVHPNNPVSGLTAAEIGGIFDGTIANWKDVGGPDAVITVICREESSGTRRSFDTIAKVKGRVTKSAQFQNSNGACRAAVASTPNAISYVTLVQTDPSVKLLKVDGVEPTIESVRAGSYPFAATDFLLTREDPAGLSKEFIDFALSPEGQKLIVEAGLIPVK